MLVINGLSGFLSIGQGGEKKKKLCLVLDLLVKCLALLLVTCSCSFLSLPGKGKPEGVI